MKNLLPVCMFLLIYSPKIGGSIDSMSIFCSLTFVMSFLVDQRTTIFKNIGRPTLMYILFGAVMVGYVLILKAFYGLTDNYQVLRFGRVIINVLGIFGLVRLYIFYFRGENYGERLIFHLWCCVIAHSVLMLLMFLIPAVNNFVLTQLVQLDENNRTFETRLLGQRIGGLTSTWDAASGIQSLGILLLPFILHYKRHSKKARILIYLSIPISFIAIFVSGVTGLVNIVVVSVLLLLFNFRYLQKYIGRAIKLVVVFLLLAIPIVTFLRANADADWVRNSSIGRTLFMITQDETMYQRSNRSVTADETLERISNNMYFIPDEDIVFLFGKGGSGRSEDYRIKADPGPTLNLHNLGIFFVLLVYGYCFSMLLKAIRVTRSVRLLGMATTAILLTIMIIDAKVMYLLARQSLSIMLIAYYTIFACLSRTNKA
ncbi:hypothetical protein FXV77_06820 [Sphingobacterium phlebotomi]|uniref:O-antigen ligase-like membrane protein n=1 Tax=Sphingobacterium phlebotomi TaxID=2605433 RepID=A0A5D4HBK0_9SPHI|nr:hypothetical protein [Sphingobacterium phlebotomi]TYR36885.1 hypothetical protein FXV77_06820 [Sphingobacterium phlebotomi]